MIHIASFITLDAQSPHPVYLQIANAIQSLIERRILLPGIRIQTSRSLSIALDIHRKTVIAAYNELLYQGWLVSRARKGMYVSTNLPEWKPVSFSDRQSTFGREANFDIQYRPEKLLQRSAAQGKCRIVFNDGFPDVRLAPLQQLFREYRSIGSRKSSRSLFSYSAKEGNINLRRAIAQEMRTSRGMAVDAEHILITKGGQMGVFLAASLLIKPGDCVIVGAPGFFLVNLMLERLGAKLVYASVDEQGISVADIDRLVKKHKAKLLYVIPHHHHPTTVTLSPERRRQILSIAAEHRIAVIEDDYDFDLHYEGKPVLPMARADPHGNVIYVGTLSKLLAPSIRVGFIVAPAALVSLLGQHRFVIDLQGDSVMEEALATMYTTGVIHRHVRKVRRIYQKRRDNLCDTLKEKLEDHVSFQVPQGGMSVWMQYRGVTGETVSAAAERMGLWVTDGIRYDVPGRRYNGISMGFASMTETEMDAGIQLFIRAVRKACTMG